MKHGCIVYYSYQGIKPANGSYASEVCCYFLYLKAQKLIGNETSSKEKIFTKIAKICCMS